jgi:hypothetical protein
LRHTIVEPIPEREGCEFDRSDAAASPERSPPGGWPAGETEAWNDVQSTRVSHEIPQIFAPAFLQNGYPEDKILPARSPFFTSAC